MYDRGRLGDLLRHSWLVAFVVLMNCVLVPEVSARKAKPTWKAVVKVEQGYNDNVRSAQDGPKKNDTTFTTADVRIERKGRSRGLVPDEFWTRIRGRIYSQFNDRNFVETRGRVSYEIGRSTDALLEFGLVPRRLRLEENATANNAFATEYDLNVGIQTRFGPQGKGRARFLLKDSYDDFRGGFSERSAQTTTRAGELRYQLLPSLGAKLGAEYGQRFANGEDFNRKEWRYKTGLRKRFAGGTTLDLRASYRDGDYTVDTTVDSSGGKNKNFGRRDTIWEYEVKLSVPLSASGLTVAIRYRYKDAASSRTSRIFDLNEIGLAFSYDIAH